MKIKGIDVIITHKNRPEIIQCVESLLKIEVINNIIIGNLTGDQFEPSHMRYLKTIDQVQVVNFDYRLFNKGKILNQCLGKVTSRFILFSDADIIWNKRAVINMMKISPMEISVIRQVKELNSSISDNKKTVIKYTVRNLKIKSTICISEIPNIKSAIRGGPGLLLTTMEIYKEIGGYKEIFEGWGWEDQDFLIRAKLIGIKIRTSGVVIHISHGDEKRNITNSSKDKVKSRNDNLLKSINEIRALKIYGPLKPIKQKRYTKQLVVIDRIAAI